MSACCTGSYSDLNRRYGRLPHAKFPAADYVGSNFKKLSQKGREVNAQRRVNEFQEYFSKALLLNGDCDFREDEATLARVRGVHETLGIDSANSDLICAAMSGVHQLHEHGQQRQPTGGDSSAEPQPELQPESEEPLWL